MSDQRRRTDTREQIQEIALELFAEQGYEKTSLREIADRLGVTKAALYYHFKAKDDILRALFDDHLQRVAELADWAEGQPGSQATREELVRRYAELVRSRTTFTRFMHENQASVREFAPAERMKEQMVRLTRVLGDPDDGDLVTRMRSRMALFALHGAPFLLSDSDVDEETKVGVALEVALGLLKG
ncbi:MAG: TetR family transcriptional regulator [Streptosporangiales bacterium]|nr:TetR family transcriptional regulator [Streptosporangiales bacterium]